MTLNATPGDGWAFTGWSGACSGTAECTVTMDAAKSVTATFQPQSSLSRIDGGSRRSHHESAECDVLRSEDRAYTAISRVRPSP